MSRGQGPLYEEGVDLDVVDVGDGECQPVVPHERSGAQHHGLSLQGRSPLWWVQL